MMSVADLESDDLIPPSNDEIKDNQWLGVTVHSQGTGGKVLVSLESNKEHRYHTLFVILNS